MKDLDVRQESIKILEENIGNNLYNISQSSFFHDTSPTARETKDKRNFVDFIKINSFCRVKETVKKTKRQPTEWENIFAKNTTDNVLYPRSTKNFSNSIHEKQITNQKMGRRYEQTLFQ